MGNTVVAASKNAIPTKGRSADMSGVDVVLCAIDLIGLLGGHQNDRYFNVVWLVNDTARVAIETHCPVSKRMSFPKERSVTVDKCKV